MKGERSEVFPWLGDSEVVATGVVVGGFGER